MRHSEPEVRRDNGSRASGQRPRSAGNGREQIERELHGAQVDFVDNPREAVARAERVVDHMLRELTEELSAMRSGLETRDGAGEAETERLRRALQHYRDLAHRLMRPT